MQKHILLVDSDAESLDRLSRTLRLHDYRVSEARDGAEGLSLVDSLRPDCIIFDVDLPRVSGTIMYSRLRRSDRPLSAATRGRVRWISAPAFPCCPRTAPRKRCLRLCGRRQPDAFYPEGRTRRRPRVCLPGTAVFIPSGRAGDLQKDREESHARRPHRRWGRCGDVKALRGGYGAEPPSYPPEAV